MGFMITKDDIKNLADLARVDISLDEMEKMTKEVDSILGYVGVINNTTADLERSVPKHRNIMRDDEPTTQSGEYTEKLLQNAPSREGNYLKVKKIL